MKKVNVKRLTTVSRKELLDSFPEGLKIAEIGVKNGNYSKFIALRNPSELYLIDCWAHIPGDSVYSTADRANVEDAKQEVRYQQVVKRYKDNESVSILRGMSGDVAPQVPNGSLDAVYIDADHSFEGCFEDLKDWAKKIGPGGFIWGHDYCYAKHIQVPTAVHLFLDENPEWKLEAITNEPKTSSPSYILTREDSIITSAINSLPFETVEREVKAIPNKVEA